MRTMGVYEKHSSPLIPRRVRFYRLPVPAFCFAACLMCARNVFQQRTIRHSYGCQLLTGCAPPFHNLHRRRRPDRGDTGTRSYRRRGGPITDASGHNSLSRRLELHPSRRAQWPESSGIAAGGRCPSSLPTEFPALCRWPHRPDAPSMEQALCTATCVIRPIDQAPAPQEYGGRRGRIALRVSGQLKSAQSAREREGETTFPGGRLHVARTRVFLPIAAHCARRSSGSIARSELSVDMGEIHSIQVM